MESLPAFEGSFLPILDEAFERFANDPCLRFNGEVFSYREVGARSAQVANSLIAAGFRPGMKGAVYSLNSAWSFIATLGIVRAGGVWIPINPRNSAEDNVAILKRFQVDSVFFQNTFLAPIQQFAQGSTQFICLDSAETQWPQLLEWLGDAGDESPDVDVSGTDLLSIPQTGGTTGLPKGVMLSHRNFRALEYGMRTQYGDERAVVLSAAPMTHVGGRMAICGLSSGVRCEILEAVEPQLILRTIQEQEVTHTFLPPTGVYALLDQPNIRDFDLSSLKSFSYGSAPISTERLKEAIRVIGPVMRGGFGQTECPMFIARLPPEEHFVGGDIGGELESDARLRSVGRATVLSEIAIVDENGEVLAVGERGEIAVKGPMVSEGYYEDEVETAKIRVNGWHLTGDIGYLDEQGYLYIVDRKKDMIITGGFNVYSSEVEQALMEIDGVQLAVVFGAPDEHWGEAVVAQVQLNKDSSLGESEVITLAKETIGSVKAPKRVMFVEEFPRTPVGKIDKKKIRSEVWVDQERAI